jgi:hypothetical protein
MLNVSGRRKLADIPAKFRPHLGESVGDRLVSRVMFVQFKNKSRPPRDEVTGTFS